MEFDKRTLVVKNIWGDEQYSQLTERMRKISEDIKKNSRRFQWYLEQPHIVKFKPTLTHKIGNEFLTGWRSYSDTNLEIYGPEIILVDTLEHNHPGSYMLAYNQLKKFVKGNISLSDSVLLRKISHDSVDIALENASSEGSKFKNYFQLITVPAHPWIAGLIETYGFEFDRHIEKIPLG